MRQDGCCHISRPAGEARVLSEASQLRAEKMGSRATAQSATRHQRGGMSLGSVPIWGGSCPRLLLFQAVAGLREVTWALSTRMKSLRDGTSKPDM